MKKIVYLSLLLLASCGGNNQEKQSADGAVSDTFLQEVVSVKATVQQLQKEFTLSGKVTADPDRTISYSPLVSGVIVKSYFSLGDRVQKGQTMLDIRSAELSSLQSELTVAKRNFESVKSLHQSGMATDRELVEARSMLEKLESDFALYGENKGNGIFSIAAPMSGYVIEKYGNAGSTVSSDSEPLFSIADLSSIWIVANVYAGNMQFVHEGQRVEITSVAYPKEVFKGKINFLSQVFDPADKALKARIVLPNSDLKLKPEMSVVVKLLNESNAQLVTVPTDAVIFDKNRYFVVVGNKDFEIREIIPFDQHNGFTYISEGLQQGELVVTKNQLLIYNEIKGK